MALLRLYEAGQEAQKYSNTHKDSKRLRQPDELAKLR